MLERLLRIESSDPALVRRGRLLKGAVALIGLAALLDLPLVLSNPAAPAALIGAIAVMIVMMGVCFWLLERGHVVATATFFSLLILAGILVGAPPETLLSRTAAASLLLPVLIAGLGVGANAALAVGGLALVGLGLVAAFSGVPWQGPATLAALIIAANTTLIWLLSRSLEGEAATARASAEEAVAGRDRIAARERELSELNDSLRGSNDSMQQLLELVNDLEAPLIRLPRAGLLLPLQGHLDAGRAGRLLPKVLQAVHEQRARTIIIDVTAISGVDTASLGQLLQLITSCKLLGADVVLTGVQAALAHSLVGLGANLSQIKTAASLEQALGRQLGEGEPLPADAAGWRD
ncbi:MAG TPA: STAS domain-containing protein [Herpetosiphonaceae bacterium]